MSDLEISGRFEELQLGGLLKLIRMSRQTGTLHLNDHGQEGAIEFHDGNIVRARASWKYDDLGTLLLARGAITRDELTRAVSAQSDGREAAPIGRILIDLGLASEVEVREAMRTQVDRVVGHLLQLGRGDFRFRPRAEAADEITQDVAEVMRELSVKVESSLQRRARSSSPALQLRELKRQFLAFRQAGSESALVGAALRALEPHAARIVLLELGKEGFRATDARGRGANGGGSVLERLTGVALDKNTTPALWRYTKLAWIGDTADREFAPLYTRIGKPTGRSYLVMRLDSVGGPRRVVYGDQGSSLLDSPCVDLVELIALEATLVIERLRERAKPVRKRPPRRKS